MVKREGKLEKEIVLVLGSAIAVFLLWRWNKGNQVSEVKNIGLRDSCDSGQVKVPLGKCMAMTPQCMNAPSFKCVDKDSPHAKFRSASGCGYSNAAGGPVINVGGDTYDMQPTLAWNQGDFFGQTQGFGAGNLVCEPCPPRFRGTRQACGGTGCYNRLGQKLAEAGTGIPPGMSVQYTQV